MVSPMTSIADRVVKDLLNDGRTKEAEIEVAFGQGTVTLTGAVQSEAVRQAAEEIARRQPEVVTVINELTVG